MGPRDVMLVGNSCGSGVYARGQFIPSSERLSAMVNELDVKASRPKPLHDLPDTSRIVGCRKRESLSRTVFIILNRPFPISRHRSLPLGVWGFDPTVALGGPLTFFVDSAALDCGGQVLAHKFL